MLDTDTLSTSINRIALKCSKKIMDIVSEQNSGFADYFNQNIELFFDLNQTLPEKITENEHTEMLQNAIMITNKLPLDIHAQMLTVFQPLFSVQNLTPEALEDTAAYFLEFLSDNIDTSEALFDVGHREIAYEHAAKKRNKYCEKWLQAPAGARAEEEMVKNVEDMFSSYQNIFVLSSASIKEGLHEVFDDMVNGILKSDQSLTLKPSPPVKSHKM